MKTRKTSALVLGFALTTGAAFANAPFEIYPRPQQIEYREQTFQISKDVNVVLEQGIDSYTKKRLAKVLKAHGITFTTSPKLVPGKTNILVGINQSGGAVDQYFNSKVSHQETFFDKNDSHIVSIADNVIGVLGDDTDSAFYGITTLKHIFNQIDNRQITELRIDDYSNVKHRGFIEGYYGNPWSNEDRAELMRFGGDYKLNTYFFAPKDDIYHNKKWRELYPEKELAEIKKLAQVGNETKNKYVYALHPFMHSAIRFDTEANYQHDLDIIKAKFVQLLENDVRAFSILADDAGVPPQGPETYVKLLNDLTNWLIEQKNQSYPDLVTDLPFCSNDYMGNGSSPQLKVVNQAPQSVSIIMTGGRIWGEVSEGFTSNFKNNISSPGLEGRPPYLWINWPCSDNSKQHLIMGGNDTFLHPGVNPNNIAGIVLNPMQQAEANKSALFAIADYGWNVWDDKAQADQNWHDSFKYMNHGTAEETKASTALRTISRHMINQNMDGRVRALQESVELAPQLNALRQQLKSGNVDKAAIASLISEFEALQQAAAYYKENPGNPRTRDQIIYWLDCWQDTTTAAINYLKCLDASMDGNKDAIWNYYSTAHAAFEKSKTYKFWYVSHYQNAQVGVQHIVPFIKDLGKHLNSVVSSIVDPSKVIETYITNRSDAPQGKLSALRDGDAKTGVVYKSPTSIASGDYIGIQYNNPIHLERVEFLVGTTANPKDTFAEARIEITKDGENWKPLDGQTYQLPTQVKAENLDLEVRGVRLVATKPKANTWLGVREILVNEEAAASQQDYQLTATASENIGIKMGGSLKDITDGSPTSGPSFAKNPYENPNRDGIPADAFIRADFAQPQKIGTVKFVQAAGDKINRAALEYSADGTNWQPLHTFKKSAPTLTFDASESDITAKALRIRNLEQTAKWWAVKEFSVTPPVKKSLRDAFTNTDAQLKVAVTPERAVLEPTKRITLKPGQFIGIKLDRIKDLKKIRSQVTNKQLTVEASANAVEWSKVNGNALPDARFVRLVNHTKQPVTTGIQRFEVLSNEIHPVRYVKGHAEIYNNSKPEQAFDGDFTTTVFFNRGFNEGDAIVYDLGQVLDIDNLKYVVFDTDTDHVRDAKFQLSLDGKNWRDAFTTASKTDDRDAKPQDNGYKHGSLSDGIIPISHSYLEGENLGMKARYFRILATKTYPHRWIRISEVLINDGAYIRTTNDPTYVSNPIELKGHGPEMMVDGDLTTSYRPNTQDGKIKSGSISYKLSEDTRLKQINIVQDGNAISNAKVMVRTGADQWQQLGTLSKSLNELNTAQHDHIFEIKIEWTGTAPSIYEIAYALKK
ncbi:beta-N-acetylglucosaminidase domain-containing protein [Sulfuriroseicoccus oceanibius]|uniref:Beta-N-acetylglucosaminidase domain-containing protein n=1 Tax=Sulfuriroseicoccus oceanibius TaxID=2707525 RepID=A0A6B3L943_9BACT|nr:beta-N-acetylglucosaminidase domain-containing protein [Sulfuriroseicoccus oceanibius]QQL45665.1 beta-N-acetylglucosaminidase domain-containing protein [Sulfuriroseicoccus oceanibius]